MKIDLIVFPLHDWKKCEREGFRTRDAHLILEFEKNPLVKKILIIDRPISLTEMLIKKCWWRVKNGKVIYKRSNACLTQVSKKTFVLDILSFDLLRPLILRKKWWDYIFKQPIIIKKVKEAIKYLNLDNEVLFLWTPFSTGVVEKLEEKLLVFDALDNWLRHPEIQKGQGGEIKEGYEKIKKEADLIFTNSEALKLFMETGLSNVFCIPNGVDIDFFQPRQFNKLLDDLKNISRPIIGYAGKLAQRIDINLLIFLSNKIPEVSFVFIGPVLNRRWIKPLCKLKNFHLLGDKHYSMLPDYLQAFDICIIPHNVGKLENEGDPIKLYEYLVAGKPVVTTNISGVNVFKDVITIAKTKEEFLEGVIRYIQELNRGDDMSEKLRRSISQDCYWSSKASKMINLIIKKCEEKDKL